MGGSSGMEFNQAEILLYVAFQLAVTDLVCLRSKSWPEFWFQADVIVCEFSHLAFIDASQFGLLCCMKP